MKKVFLISILLLQSGSLSAQSQQRLLAWSDNAQLIDVNNYTVTMSIDSSASITITPLCKQNNVSITLIDCTTPINIASGLHTFVLTNSNTKGSASSNTSINFNPSCLDANGNPSVQLRVLDYTTLVPISGQGRLLWTITSPNRIINITASLNGNPIQTIIGDDLTSVAGINFVGPAISGQYSLVVSATDVGGCKADTSATIRMINVP